MVICMDVSIATCKAEGYLMIEYDGRKKFDPKEYYRAFCYWPEYDNLAGELVTDTFVCFDDLAETYNENKTGLDSFAETGVHVDFISPTYRDLLNLASDINSYMGLD